MAKKQKKLTPKRERKLIKAAGNSGRPLVESRITIDPQSTFMLTLPVTVEKGRRIYTAAKNQQVSLVDYINQVLDSALALEESTEPPIEVLALGPQGDADSAPHPELPSSDTSHDNRPAAIGAA